MSSSHFRHPRPRLSKGFTLIELLVVVSIIALLVAILVPALSEAREAAQNVVCQSNLHQIALATSMYIDDNNERFYWTRGNQWMADYSSEPNHYTAWFKNGGVLGPYLQGDVYSVAQDGCPTRPNDDWWADGDYMVNIYIIGRASGHWRNPPDWWPAGRHEIRNPSRKIVILETVEFDPNSNNNSYAPDGFWVDHGLRIGASHHGNNNILWADMHVAPMLKADFMMSSTLIDPSFLYPDD